MKKYTLFLLVFVINWLSALSETVVLDYTITKNENSFTVALKLKGDASGITKIKLYSDWAGDNKVKFLNVEKTLNVNKFYKDKADSNYLVLEHAPKKNLTITYSVKNSVASEFPKNGETFLPLVKQQYFSIIGYNFFIYPQSDSSKNCIINLHWKNIPTDFKLLNSYGLNEKEQTIKEVMPEDFLSAFFVGGQMRIYTFKVQNLPVHFGIYGKWNFKDEEMFSLIKKTISYQRNFWKDKSLKYFAIMLTPAHTENSRSRSMQGTGLANSFASWSTNGTNINPSSFLLLYNHELLHNWIGGAIEADTPEESNYWFTEGFTDYYTRKNMYASGLIDLEEFRTLTDSILAAQYGSPVKDAPNDSINKFNFWNSRLYEKLPYNRGAIFALFINEWIKKETKNKFSLDDVMFSMLEKCKNKKRLFNHVLLEETIIEVTALDANKLVDDYIIKGKSISLNEWNTILPNAFTERSKVVFYETIIPKHDVLKPKDVIEFVGENSPEGNAGLLVGDTIKGFSLYNEPKSKNELTILREGKNIVISYYPSKEIMVPCLNKDSEKWLKIVTDK